MYAENDSRPAIVLKTESAVHHMTTVRSLLQKDIILDLVLLAGSHVLLEKVFSYIGCLSRNERSSNDQHSELLPRDMH